MLNIRRNQDRLIFNMVVPIPGKDGLYIETGVNVLLIITVVPQTGQESSDEWHL